MNPDTLQEALAIAEQAGTVREAAVALRARFRSLAVVVVDALDMRGETPAAIGQRCQLFFGANDGHCWAVTADASRVAGLFIAQQA